MAHSGDTKFAETIKRLTTLYEYGSKASDKAIVEALKLGARQAIDELLTLFDQMPSAGGQGAVKTGSNSDSFVLIDKAAATQSTDTKGLAGPSRSVNDNATQITHSNEPDPMIIRRIAGPSRYIIDHATQTHPSNELDPTIVKSICRYCRRDSRPGVPCACSDTLKPNPNFGNVTGGMERRPEANEITASSTQRNDGMHIQRRPEQGQTSRNRGWPENHYGVLRAVKHEEDHNVDRAESFLSRLDGLKQTQHPGSGGLKRPRDSYRPGDGYAGRGGHAGKRGRYDRMA